MGAAPRRFQFCTPHSAFIVTMSLRLSCTLLSPLYDLVAGPLFRTARQRSLAALPPGPGSVLVNGVGSGLDLPFLPHASKDCKTTDQ
jgi:hypothetical protein